MTVSTLRVREPADTGKIAGIRLAAGTRAEVQLPGYRRTGGRRRHTTTATGQRVNAGSRALIRAWWS
jgi:hypothetical protein